MRDLGNWSNVIDKARSKDKDTEAGLAATDCYVILTKPLRNRTRPDCWRLVAERRDEMARR